MEDSYRAVVGGLRDMVGFLGLTPEQVKDRIRQHKIDYKRKKYENLERKLEDRASSYRNIKNTKSRLRKLNWNLWKRSYFAWINSAYNLFTEERAYLKRLIDLKGYAYTAELLYKAEDPLGLIILSPDPKHIYCDLVRKGDLDVTRNFIKKSLEEGKSLWGTLHFYLPPIGRININRNLPSGSPEAEQFIEEIIDCARKNYRRYVSRERRNDARYYTHKEWQEAKVENKQSFEEEINRLRNRYQLTS